ncbi:MAG: hypothetical protein OHK0021_07980 [Bryobacter sp.]
MASIQQQRVDNAVILTLQHPPVNALTRTLAGELSAALSELSANPPSRIILTGEGRIFIAGADLREIQRITQGEAPPELPYLNPLLEEIENFPAPVVMAINGTTLGIGLETALAGHMRLAVPSATLGLPEVKLGLIPGAGGTQRLPRLVGPARALAMMESGTPISAEEAKSAGLVDAIVAEGELLATALTIPAPLRKTSALPLNCSRAARAMFAAYSAGEFATGLAKETAIFREALQSGEARALVHLFFAERECQKLPQPLPNGEAAPALLPAPTGRVVEVIYSDSTSGPLLQKHAEELRQARTLPVFTKEPLLPRLAPLADAGDSQVLQQTAEQLVSEGVVARLSDVDILLVYGYGLPAEQSLSILTYHYN